MIRTLGRVLLLPIAFIISALVTLFVIVSLGQERIVEALAGRNPDDLPIGAAFDLMGFGLRLFSVYTLLPAILVIIVGEVGRIRSAMYYVPAAGAALAIVPFLTRLDQPATALALSPAVWQVLATAGFAGGFVYWLIAGRNA
jgi:hypothetical protein